jgi:YEATS domain-containing protein 4
MEKDEADRLETMRRAVLAEADKYRLLLQEREKELDALKKQTEA